MERVISSQDKQCRLAFNRAIEECEAPRLQDDFDRYKVWAAKVGASHSGPTYKRSLGYRLREAREYKDQILAILDRLEQPLTQAHKYATGVLSKSLSSNSDDSSRSEDEDANDVDAAEEWTLSEDEEGATDTARDPSAAVVDPRKARPTGLEWLSRKSHSKLQPTIDSISSAITCLYSIPIREAASYTRLNRYRKAKRDEFELDAHFDRLFVRDLFVLADEKVVTRLGKFVTERRRLLRYRELHNEELQRESSESKEAKSAVREDVVAAVESSMPDPDTFTEHQQSAMPMSSLRASTMRPKENPLFDPSYMLTGVVVEADEVSSIATTVVERDLIHITDRPKDAKGEELDDFICPSCRISRHIHSAVAWKRHVLDDLEPYVCTYRGCAEPDWMYSNKADWFFHESQHHASYFCGQQDHEHCISAVTFVEHMRIGHRVDLDEGSSLDTFRRRIERKSGNATSAELRQAISITKSLAIYNVLRYLVCHETSIVR